MIKRFIISTVALVFSTVIFAEQVTPKPPEELHTIELIVFKYNDTDDASAEFWKPAKAHTFTNTVEVAALPSLITLTQEKNKIANNNKYTLLTYQAWKQKLAAHDKPVRIQAGNQYDFRGNNFHELDGTVSISKNKFIKINTNLFLTEPTYGITRMINGLASFPMQNTRNTKEKELNYFDNPAFGLLIKVTPATPTTGELLRSN